MGNITLAIPKDIHQDMKRFSEIKWSEVARKAITKKIEMLKLADKLAQKSKLSEKDVLEWGKKIKAAASKRFLDEHCT